MDDGNDPQDKTPPEDVEHDEKAIAEAAKQMHSTGQGDTHDPDPTGGHDPDALRDAARKMHAEDA